MLNSLENIFKDIELSWIDSVNDIEETNEFFNLLSIFPNLEKIFQDLGKKNKDEYQRTIRHIFRSFKVFFLIISDDFSHETISEESIAKIREKTLNQHSQNELIIPILLIYHDIGRLLDNKKHPFHSYDLISKMNLLDNFNLSYIDKLLLKKIIHYHLLIATIFTGESTFYGIYSLLNDTEFIKLLSSETSINRFIDIMEIFTYIDILGYVYTKIYDHYVKYYDEVSSKLKIILNSWPDNDSALKKAKAYSEEWLEWRLAGALRIFQFVETKPYLTKEFYYNKLKESTENSDNNPLQNLNWELIKKNYLNHSYKIQMRYSLALLMILAFGSFQRMGLKINTGISYRLILFWTLLSKEVKRRTVDDDLAPWNVFYEGFPHWSKLKVPLITILSDEDLMSIISNSKHEYDKSKKEFNLILDFTPVFS
jgi:hypothetical protein